jgi:hypothetical protein
MRLFVACAFLGLGAALSAGAARAADDATCTTMKTIADSIGKSNGKMIDQVTKQETVTADCEGKVFAVTWSVTVPSTGMKADWVDIVKGNLEGIVCRDMDFMSAMEGGWKVKSSWTLADGKTAEVELNCAN